MKNEISVEERIRRAEQRYYNTIEKNYNNKYDKITAFIKDSEISNVFIKDKSVKVSPKVIIFFYYIVNFFYT